jgi:hypothetical protein
MSDLTKAEKLLVAAGKLVAQGSVEFSVEDLVVAAHRAFPGTFAMKGYPQFPDSNPVYTQVMGKSAPLIVRGWLDKVGEKKYRLTPKGLDDLNGLEGAPAVSSAKLERKRDEGAGAILTSAAFELAREGRDDEITFYQFCRLAGLGASDKWQVVQGKLTHTEHFAEEMERLGEAGQSLQIRAKQRNMKFEPDDLRLVKPLFQQLQQRFKAQIDEWRRNTSG